jgi:hypothetical protein
MRNAETVLSVIRDRGDRGLPLDDMYRQLFNINLYLLAYSRIYKNDGAMTQGAIPGTVDGMSIKKIENLIEDIRYERFRWTPVRRINIPKKNGKTRPLGIPTWNDKLVQEVIRLILEAYYEPQFSNSSHGFRPKRGCHTALTIIDRTWQGTKWFIEGDIRGCFDNIDHKIWLNYVRYADDFLLGFIGSYQEAKEIKEKVKTFLAEKLKLELSPEKTLITNARNEAARFLGYDILVQYSDDKHTNGKRSINGIVALRIPARLIEEKCALYMKNDKPIHRPELINDDNFTIINIFQSEFRGYVQFYSLAQNIAWLRKLQWIMSTSLMKTLACKHKTSVNKICAKYFKTVKLPQGLRKCVEITVTVEGKKPLIARFGGIQLKRNLRATIEDLPAQRKPAFRNELIKRLFADECEICGAKGNIEVHHIRALKDLKVKGRKEKPQWMQIMSARKRKTLMVCSQCHDAIHSGKPTRKRVP